MKKKNKKNNIKLNGINKIKSLIFYVTAPFVFAELRKELGQGRMPALFRKIGQKYIKEREKEKKRRGERDQEILERKRDTREREIYGQKYTHI